MPLETYTLEQGEDDIGDLRGSVDLLAEAHSKDDFDAGATPNTPTSGVTSYSSAGHEKYVSADGNAYNTGRVTVYMAATQTIGSTTPVVLLAQAVGAGTYKFASHVMLVPNGVGAAGNIRFRLQGPAFSAGSYTLVAVYNGSTGIARFDNTSGFNVFMQGPAATNGLPVLDCVIQGLCTFTASGTLQVTAALTAAGDAQAVAAVGSDLEVFPIT